MTPFYERFTQNPFKDFKLEVAGDEVRDKALDNEDLRPFPLERRTWNTASYNIFWFAAVTNVANWLSAGTWLSAGLGVWTGVAVTFASQVLTGLLMAMNGRPGSVYHFGFPAYCRASWGVYGSWWPALNRAIMACVWQGVNSVTGAQCVYVLLHSIFPGIANIPNHMPAGSALDSAGMMCMFLFWLLVATTLNLDIKRWPILFRIKAATFTLSSIGMLALTVSRAGGAGYILRQSYSPTVQLTGSEYAWTIVRFLLLSPASCGTFISNASDWQRMATTRWAPFWGQILGFPLSSLIDNIIASVVSSTSTKVVGEFIWNPVPYLDAILTQSYDAPTRAGAFFISLGFIYSLLYSCVIENIFPAGNDIAALFPKYISIKRAFWICMASTWALNPWYLLGSASIFITFLSSYQLFLFSIIGVIATDYYLIRKGRIILKDLYHARKDGAYRYTFGVNWRALAGYAAGLAANFAGFLANMGAFDASLSLRHSYYFAFITTMCAAGLVYWILMTIFPPTNPRARTQKGKFKEPTAQEVEDVFFGPSRDSLDEAVVDDAASEEKKGDGVVTATMPVV